MPSGGIGRAELQQRAPCGDRTRGIARLRARLRERAPRRSHERIYREVALGIKLHGRPIFGLGRQLREPLIGIDGFIIDGRPCGQYVSLRIFVTRFFQECG